MPQKCPKCGKESIENAKFCIVCGESLINPAQGGKTRICLLLDNRYEVLSVVKSGAMGCIYKARDIRLNNIVALKKMFSSPESLVEQEYAEKRFEEEAKLLSALHHSGLPKVFDYFKETDPETKQMAHYLVMTFIEGIDLETIIKNRNRAPFPIDEAIAYFRQILLILNYIHTHNPAIIYRDLNPRNIMLSSGTIFLVDFGIARVFKPEKKGTAIGTPGYASPEQYKGEAEPRSDLYSLGVVMHYLLTGRDPEDSSQQIFKFQPIRELNPSVPEYLESIIMSLLSIVPDQRLRSAEDVLNILNTHKKAPQQAVTRTQNVMPPLPPPSQDHIKLSETVSSFFSPVSHLLKYIPWAVLALFVILLLSVGALLFPKEQKSGDLSSVTYSPSIQTTIESTNEDFEPYSDSIFQRQNVIPELGQTWRSMKVYSPDKRYYAYVEKFSGDVPTKKVEKKGGGDRIALVNPDRTEVELFKTNDTLAYDYRKLTIEDWTRDSRILIFSEARLEGGVHYHLYDVQEQRFCPIADEDEYGKCVLRSLGWNEDQFFLKGYVGPHLQYFKWDLDNKTLTKVLNEPQYTLTRYALVKKDDSEQTFGERIVIVPDSKPSSLNEQNDPIACVQFYYRSINIKNFHAAYALESERSRSKTSYEKWYQDIWSNNISIAIRSNVLKSSTDREAEVSVELISTDKVKGSGKEEQAVYAGAVKLIQSEGAWWIDGFSIAPKT